MSGVSSSYGWSSYFWGSPANPSEENEEVPTSSSSSSSSSSASSESSNIPDPQKPVLERELETPPVPEEKKEYKDNFILRRIAPQAELIYNALDFLGINPGKSGAVLGGVTSFATWNLSPYIAYSYILYMEGYLGVAAAALTTGFFIPGWACLGAGFAVAGTIGLGRTGAEALHSKYKHSCKSSAEATREKLIEKLNEAISQARQEFGADLVKAIDEDYEIQIGTNTSVVNELKIRMSLTDKFLENYEEYKANSNRLRDLKNEIENENQDLKKLQETKDPIPEETKKSQIKEKEEIILKKEKEKEKIAQYFCGITDLAERDGKALTKEQLKEVKTIYEDHLKQTEATLSYQSSLLNPLTTDQKEQINLYKLMAHQLNNIKGAPWDQIPDPEKLPELKYILEVNVSEAFKPKSEEAPVVEESKSKDELRLYQHIMEATISYLTGSSLSGRVKLNTSDKGKEKKELTVESFSNLDISYDEKNELGKDPTIDEFTLLNVPPVSDNEGKDYSKRD